MTQTKLVASVRDPWSAFPKFDINLASFLGGSRCTCEMSLQSDQKSGAEVMTKNLVVDSVDSNFTSSICQDGTWVWLQYKYRPSTSWCGMCEGQMPENSGPSSLAKSTACDEHDRGTT